MSGENAGADVGYVAVRCADPRCGGPLAPDVLDALQDSVRASRYGILVISGCTCGPVTCRTRTAGPMVLVQPCIGTRPCGPAVRIGPVTADEDVGAVRACLAHGRLDVECLPLRLLALQRRRPSRN